MRIEITFDFAVTLVLKMRRRVARKWLIKTVTLGRTGEEESCT